MEALTAAIAEATAAGDIRLARVAHDALGQLIEEPAGGASLVADLTAARTTKRKG